MARCHVTVIASLMLAGLTMPVQVLAAPRDLTDVVIDESYRSQGSVAVAPPVPSPAIPAPSAAPRSEAAREQLARNQAKLGDDGKGSSVVFWVSVAAITFGLLIWLRHRSFKAGRRSRADIDEMARKESGLKAEHEVDEALRQVGVPVLHEVYVPTRGHHTEIDHLALVGSQIWVIETKAWTGDLYGRVQDATWRQVKRHETKTPRNPLHQNEHHLGVLRTCYGGVSFRSVVVFTKARFPEGKPEGAFTLAELPDLVRQSRDSLPSSETKMAWGDLSSLSGRQDKKAMRSKHEQRLQGKRLEPAPQRTEDEEDTAPVGGLRAIRFNDLSDMTDPSNPIGLLNPVSPNFVGKHD